jgi:hypothetical protein
MIAQGSPLYAQPDSQTPVGPAVRRRARLSEPAPVRFSETLSAEARNRAAADDRSVSSWIRKVERWPTGVIEALKIETERREGTAEHRRTRHVAR